MVMISSTVVVQQYFDKRRALAAGVANAGLSLGTIIVGPIMQPLTATFGWKGCMLILGGLSLNTCLCGALYRPLSGPRHTRAPSKTAPPAPGSRRLKKRCVALLRDTFDVRLLAAPHTAVYMVSTFLLTLALGPLYQHLPSRGLHYGLTPAQVAWLPTAMGLANLGGKVGLGGLASWSCVHRLLLFAGLCILGGASAATAGLIKIFPAFIAYCVYSGFFNGMHHLKQTSKCAQCRFIGCKICLHAVM